MQYFTVFHCSLFIIIESFKQKDESDSKSANFSMDEVSVQLQPLFLF